MWSSEIETLDAGVRKFDVLRDGAPVSYSEVLDWWRDDAEFRSFHVSLLADCPFTAYRWETPPVTTATIDRRFEFVLLQADALDRRVDPKAFAGHFTKKDSAATFANLGRDAVMVAPCPVADQSIYGHLASFVRQAPDAQVHRFWQAVSQAMRDRLGEAPVWLSTAGMGVSWLHVRLDSRPKYYGYSPFKKFS
ncbi:MAG: hypothetical protein N2C14_16360 [Planctomycetales bacterium]